MKTCAVRIREGVAVLLLLVVPVFFSCVPSAWAKDTESGTLLGVITSKDSNDVLPGAVVQVRNSVTGEIFSSGPADELGMYVSREVPFGTYDLAVETKKGFFLTSDQVAISNTVPQVLSLALAEDGEAGSKKKGAAWWKTPVGIVFLSAAVVATGLVVGHQLDDEATPESPVNP